MTPATLGPMACMSRKLPGSSSWPTFWDTRAAIGTAETPAEPISGLMVPPERMFISLASSTPPAVPQPKATTPSTTMYRVWGVRKDEPVVVAPTVRPRKMVTMLHSSFWAVLEMRSTTPQTRIRLPSISMPISVAASGSSRETMMVTAMGKMMVSVLDTCLSWPMRILRSLGVVSAFMIGGWMTGTRAM